MRCGVMGCDMQCDVMTYGVIRCDVVTCISTWCAVVRLELALLSIVLCIVLPCGLCFVSPGGCM